MKRNALQCCPSCGSDDINRKQRECRACKIGLPSGSLDVRERNTWGRAATRSAQLDRHRDIADGHAESISGIRP